MNTKFFRLVTLAFAAASLPVAVQAGTITSTVGLPPPGCSITTGCPGGTDLSGTLTTGFVTGGPADFSWTHTFGAIAGTILSATLTLDIIDADSGALETYIDSVSGSFVGTFNPVGNNSGGSPGPWRVPGDPLDPLMSISISSLLFSELTNGTITFFGDNRGLGVWGANSATLTINTQGGNTSTVPIPAALPLLLCGIGVLGAAQFYHGRQSA